MASYRSTNTYILSIPLYIHRECLHWNAPCPTKVTALRETEEKYYYTTWDLRSSNIKFKNSDMIVVIDHIHNYNEIMNLSLQVYSYVANNALIVKWSNRFVKWENVFWFKWSITWGWLSSGWKCRKRRYSSITPPGRWAGPHFSADNSLPQKNK